MLKSKGFKIILLFLIPVILFAVCSLIAPGFGLNSIMVVLSQSVIPICIGYGIAFSDAAGIFDLSAGSRVTLAAAAGGFFATTMGWGLPGMIISSLLASIIVGVIMGICHNLMRIPSLILSLGFVMLVEVAGARLLGDSSFVKVDSAITFLGKSPYKYIICVVLGVLFYLIFYRTKFCCHLRLVGENELLAKNMGINVKRVNFLAYFVGSIFLGVVGILQLCYAGAVASTLSLSSLSIVFQPLMGVLIGAQLIPILDNMAVNIVIGELCISILYNMIIGMGISSSMQNVMLGVFMLIVMSVSRNKQALTSRFKRISTRAKEA